MKRETVADQLGMNKAERQDRYRHTSGARRSVGWRADPIEPGVVTRGIGDNNAPRFDPEAPVTGFPMVMRDIAPFDAGDGTVITSRSQLRRFQIERGIEQSGKGWNADSDQDKPAWYNDYQDHEKERGKRKKVGKSDIGKFKIKKATAK
jgi:hypothetical protein